jgi:hypothetical protein
VDLEVGDLVDLELGDLVDLDDGDLVDFELGDLVDLEESKARVRTYASSARWPMAAAMTATKMVMKRVNFIVG